MNAALCDFSIRGQCTGQSNGQPSGQCTGQSTGQTSGRSTGQYGGQSSGQSSGQLVTIQTLWWTERSSCILVDIQTLTYLRSYLQ